MYILSWQCIIDALFFASQFADHRCTDVILQTEVLYIFLGMGSSLLHVHLYDQTFLFY